MSTRKIKDAKDLSTNELIYFKGHAQATYMSDGRTVEEAVNSMSGGSSGSSDFFYFDVLSAVYENGYELDENGNVSNAQFNASEYISEIETAVFNNKFVIVLDSLQVFNIEIEDFGGQTFYVYATYYSYNTWKRISISFQRSSGEVHLTIQDILEGSGSGSSGGTIDPSNFATKTELAQKQDTLVSGTNIKTINGTTILGSGDITINPITRMQFVTPAANIPIPVNTVKVITSVNTTNQTFTLLTSALNTNLASIALEQKFEIVFNISASLSTAPTITFNTGNVGTIYWINGKAPTFEVGKFYEVSFLNAGGILLGVCAEFSAS